MEGSVQKNIPQDGIFWTDVIKPVEKNKKKLISAKLVTFFFSLL